MAYLELKVYSVCGSFVVEGERAVTRAELLYRPVLRQSPEKLSKPSSSTDHGTGPARCSMQLLLATSDVCFWQRLLLIFNILVLPFSSLSLSFDYNMYRRKKEGAESDACVGQNKGPSRTRSLNLTSLYVLREREREHPHDPDSFFTTLWILMSPLPAHVVGRAGFCILGHQPC